jgi:hypothetical protein
VRRQALLPVVAANNQQHQEESAKAFDATSHRSGSAIRHPLSANRFRYV